MRLALLTLSLALAGCAGSGGSSDTPLRREETQVTTFQARVKAVDHEKRLVTLTDEAGGDEAVFHADAGVKNLAQVKPGDRLVGQLAESVVLEVRPPTEEELASGADVLEVLATAEPGEKPAGVYARQITAVLTIEAIDKAGGTATLRGPAGNSRVVPVRDPRNLERVKIGDTVVATYTEALSLEVVAPAAP